MRPLARLLTLAALLASFWCVLRWAPVSAQERTHAEQQLVELVAKVSFNEGLDSYADLALIYQVVEGHGDTAAERTRWLAEHSPCVSGRLTQDQARARPGNCAWTRNLHPSDRLPRGWPHSQHAWHRMARRWLEHLDRVRAFVDGRDQHRPCAITPTTWDGARWQRDAERRGYVPVVCTGEAHNVAYVRAGDAS